MHTYEDDLAAWGIEQAIALRNHRGDQLDWEHLAEEIEGLVASEKWALKSQIRSLIMHLLKWEKQSIRRSRFWANAIENAREEIKESLEEKPSLRNSTEEFTSSMYRRAARDAENETGISKCDFPEECPYTFDQIMTIPTEI
jgi:hypothetical protein